MGLRNWLLLLLVSVLFALIVASNLDSSQYHSVQPPFGVQNWVLGKDAFFNEDFIRLAEDRQSKKGWFWNNIASQMLDWEVVFQFRIHGVSRVGADGMAFWYTKESKQTGDIFGNQDKFRGLGVIIDTYDNDNTGKHPYLEVLINDGTHAYNHDHDGSGKELGGCPIAARNLDSPSSIKVSYNRGILEVFYNLENSGNWISCVKKPAALPRGYYFGFSAATGHLADNHDLYGVEIKDLDPRAPQYQNSPVDSFSKLLSGIHNEIRSARRTDGKTPAVSLGKDVVEQKLESLSQLVNKLQTDLRNLPSGSAPVSGGSPSCTGLSSAVNNAQKAIEKLEKEQNKRSAEAKDKLHQIVQEVGNNQSFDFFGLLNLVVLIALALFIVVVYLIYDEDKRKRHFSIR